MYCAYCGRKIELQENANFCIYCGKEIKRIKYTGKTSSDDVTVQTGAADYVPTKASKKQGKKWMIPVIIVAAAAVLAGILLFQEQIVTLFPTADKTSNTIVSDGSSHNIQKEEITSDVSQSETSTDNSSQNSVASPVISENLLHPYLTETTYQKDNLYEVVCDRIYLNDTESAKYPELAASLNALFDAWSSEASVSIHNFESLSEEEASTWQNTSNIRQADVLRADPVVFSLSGSESVYEAGMAHQQYGTYGWTYDTQTGRQLSLSDVVTDMSSFADLVVDKIKEKYPGLTFLLGEDSTKEELRNGECAEWNLGYEELILHFNPYSISSWNAGSQLIVLPFAEYPDLFNSTYTQPTDSWMIPFTSLRLDTNGDGDLEDLSISSHWAHIEDYLFETGFDISLGNSTFSFDNNYDTTSNNWYVLKNNGSYFLYRLGTLSSEEDGSILEIFALTNGKVEKLKTGTASDLCPALAESTLIQQDNEETKETKILLTDPLYMELPSGADSSTGAVYQTDSYEQEETEANEKFTDGTVNSITAKGYFDFSYDPDGVSNENGDVIAYIEPDAEFTERLTDTEGEEYYEIPATIMYYPDGSSGIEVQANIRFTYIALIVAKANDKYFTEYGYDIEDFIDRYNGDWPFHDEFKNYLEKGKRNSIITFNIDSYDYSTGYIETATINVPY